MKWNRLQLNLNRGTIKINEVNIQNLKNMIDKETNNIKKAILSTILNNMKKYEKSNIRNSEIFGNAPDDLLFGAFLYNILSVESQTSKSITYVVHMSNSLKRLLLKDSLKKDNIYQYLKINGSHYPYNEIDKTDIISIFNYNYLLKQYGLNEGDFSQLFLTIYDFKTIQENKLDSYKISGQDAINIFPRLILYITSIMHYAKIFDFNELEFLRDKLRLISLNNTNIKDDVSLIISEFFRSMSYDQTKSLALSLYDICNPYINSFSYQGLVFTIMENNYEIEKYLNENNYKYFKY